MNISIFAFNFGPTKSFTNGPGMSLFRFCKTISKYFSLDIFLEMKPEESIPNCTFYSINNKNKIIASAKKSEVIHYWSGLTDRCMNAALIASKYNDKVILGPNLLDCVKLEKERGLLKKIGFKKILSVNDHLKYKISFNNDIHHQMIESFIVGPDMDMWSPSADTENFILWKGNSRQYVKDVEFALKIKDNLAKYNFNILGYPRPYNYISHIPIAKKAALYINTSISETKSQTLMESWASGVPSVTHPKIYLHGKNYKTGIITNKTINDYSEAISEVMDNKNLRSQLSDGARDYALTNFSDENLINKYNSILSSIY